MLQDLGVLVMIFSGFILDVGLQKSHIICDMWFCTIHLYNTGTNVNLAVIVL